MCDLNLERCVEGRIRLQDGTSTSGRVEICYLSLWGTVCDIKWDTVDAQVACRELGYPADGARALTGSDVPDGTGPISLSYVDCNGRERALYECDSLNPMFTSHCTHSEDAGVACSEWM